MAPPSIKPPPAFISASAASEIITSDQEFNAADFVAVDEETGAGAKALVTPAALSLLNGFLDNLLFNILAACNSTQLAAIRPAVADVLKRRLAGEVVATADEELSEYMGGAEDEETEFRGGQQPAGDFDLIRSWRLTRLRCMVYTRLGDLEEEDEDEFIAQQGLGEDDDAPRRYSSHVDNITPAAAIFLTSIIEHIGERALVIAGETARSRLSAKLNDGEDEAAEAGDRKRIDHLVVEDLDMEKLALNATLGRLWRTWRKRRRGSAILRNLSHTESRESFRRRGYSLANSRKSSIATVEEPITAQEPLHEESEETLALLDPASVPLPMSDYDVQEIEVPGYSADLDGEVQTMEAMVAHKVRPRSLMVFPSPSLTPKTPDSRDTSPVGVPAVEIAKNLRHLRSKSLPNTASPKHDVQANRQPSPSASEKNKQLETMYEDDESAEFVDAAESAPGIAITTATEEMEDAGPGSTDKVRMSIVHEEDEEVVAAGPSGSETVASGRPDEQDDEVVPDQTNDRTNDKPDSARVSTPSPDDELNKDPEVIEGQGMAGKPALTSTIQRPKRISSRDVAQLAKSVAAETGENETEPVAEPVVDVHPSTEAPESTPASSATTPEATEAPHDEVSTVQVEEKAAMVSTPVTEQVQENVAHEQPREAVATPESPRPPSTSGDSRRSHKSHHNRPSPVLVTSSNRSSPTTERAAVQRMTPRPSTSIPSPVLAKARRSESFGSAWDKRPVTSGSTTSQVSSKLKGLMGRSQGESPRLRSSSETSRASGSADSVDNDAAELDKLINSDETIHYTLTPRSVREMKFPDVNRPIPRSDTADTSDLAQFLKSTGPPGDDSSRPRAAVSSRDTGEVTSLGRNKPAESPKHIPISLQMSVPANPSAAGQVRDARAPRNSAREFADWIKSGGTSSSPSQTTASPTKPPHTASTFSASTNRSNRTRLQARPAEVTGSQTSDLIDFIREGPPQPGAHRVPRKVAPSRNTLDSDDLQLDSAHRDKAQTTSSSVASTREGSTPNKSLTSLGSRTGLLDSANRINGQAKATSSNGATDFDDVRPTRTQRRVRDPYVIDDDDDDMLEDLINVRPPKREEESLIDFLRSAPPPDFDQPRPQPGNVRLSQSASSNALGLVSNAPGMMKARMLRGNDKVPNAKLSLGSLRSHSSMNNTQSSSTYTSNVGMERKPSTLTSISHRQTETSALADFLRNTGPPEPPVNRASSNPVNSRVREGTFTRFFARRKKVEA